MRKRSAFSISKDKPRRVYQDVAAIDQFGELAARKRTASASAHALGHQLSAWHKRSNDVYGRFNAFCVDCNAPVIIATERPPTIDADTYGKAVTERCTRGEPICATCELPGSECACEPNGNFV